MGLLDPPGGLPVRPVGVILPFVISASGSGDHTIIAAAGAGNFIVVLNYVLIVDGPTSLTWKQGTTAISGPMPLAAQSGISAQGGDHLIGVLDSAANALIAINLSTAVGVFGHGRYFITANI